jgi:uncharacterized protein YndB with AHSA1/START domain
MATVLHETAVVTQAHQVYVNATPEAIWDAITKSEWTDRYGYRGRIELDPRPGGTYRAFATDEMRACGTPEVVVEGEVIEANSPRKLVQTWHALFDEDIAAEATTRLTWEIEDAYPGATRLTVTHELEGAPRLAAIVGGSISEAGGGWPFVLSDLKTLLETGRPLGS